MRVDLVLRSARRAARLSQREVAERAGVARSVIGRIESGQTVDPGIGLVGRILAATGHRVRIIDRAGRDVDPDHPDDAHVDRGGRRYPAHLPLYPVTHWDRWWGWFRIAWWMHDPAVPEVTYDRRRQPLWDSPYYPNERWHDAT